MNNKKLKKDKIIEPFVRNDIFVKICYPDFCNITFFTSHI